MKFASLSKSLKELEEIVLASKKGTVEDIEKLELKITECQMDACPKFFETLRDKVSKIKVVEPKEEKVEQS